MAHPQKRSDAIEAIGSNPSASANAANNVQLPLTPRPIVPVKPEVEGVTGIQAPPALRRGDWIQFSPMAYQKVQEAQGAQRPRPHGRDVSYSTHQGIHGRSLARVARGEITAEEALAERSGDKEAVN